jgi:TatD DNase family protein
VAIGETGLDWFRDRAPRDAQLAAFRGQLAIARRTGLPVVIHCREAVDDCFAILADEAPPTVVLHCFAAADRLQEAVDRGWYCSFAGNVTYPSATDLQAAAREVPLDLLLLETDAPYLAPVPHRGKPNEPALVMETLRAVAALRELPEQELADAVDANADRAFPRLRG